MDFDGGVSLAEEIADRVASLYSGFQVEIDDSTDEADATVENTYEALPPASDPGLYGTSSPGGGVDIGRDRPDDVLRDLKNYSPSNKGSCSTSTSTPKLPGQVDTIVQTHVKNYLSVSETAFVDNFADTVAHEDGHNLGLAPAWDFLPGGRLNQAQPDIMGYACGQRRPPHLHPDLHRVGAQDRPQGELDGGRRREPNPILLKDLNAHTASAEGRPRRRHGHLPAPHRRPTRRSSTRTIT